MNSEAVQPENYFCRKCYKETQASDPVCPHCGKTMQTQAKVKSLGKLLIGLVVFIVIGSGLFTLVIMAVLLFGKISGDDIGMAITGLVFFGGGFLAGITAIIGGSWQAKHGRTSKMFVWIFVGIVALMLISGRLFSFLF